MKTPHPHHSSLAKLYSSGLLWFAEQSAVISESSKSESSKSEFTASKLAALTTAALESTTNSFRAIFAIPEIDQTLPANGLPFGQVHEWGLMENQANNRRQWFPPLLILSILLNRTLSAPNTLLKLQQQRRQLIFWIGKKCWPSPQLLEQTLSTAALWKRTQQTKEGQQNNPSLDSLPLPWHWQQHCIFIDPSCTKERLFSISETLRHCTTIAVVADVSSLPTIALRRFQLAAKHGGALALFVRPSWELELPSTSHSKWLLVPFAKNSLVAQNSLASNHCAEIFWHLNLLRAKGGTKNTSPSQTTTFWPKTWTIKWNRGFAHESDSLDLVK